MNPNTLKALEASIAHWKRMRDDPFGGETPYGDYCALCQRFDEDECTLDDERCPVSMATGEPSCEDSPWFEARCAWTAYRNIPDDKELQITWHIKCDAMIAFLESLRPNELQTNL